MLTRRAMLAATTAGLLTSPASAFEVPAHACDCHTHIIGDPGKFPFALNRRYTPPTALPAEMTALHRQLHLERVVIVTPSVYGADNAATLYGIKARGTRLARGVATIDDKTTKRDLAALAKAGIRGTRINLVTTGIEDPSAARALFQKAATRMKSLGWHIQIFANLTAVAALHDLVLDSPVPVVLDHFGGAIAAKGVSQPGFPALVDLVKSGKAYVKVSGAYRSSQHPPDYPDVAPLAQALIAANPDRILWGTDWPHPDSAPPLAKELEITPYLKIDDARLLDELPRWAPDKATLEKILVHNPVKLYEFE